MVKVRDLLIALATFLVVVPVMVHVLVAERFAASWPVTDSVSTATASSASYLDPSTLEERNDARLVRKQSIVPSTSIVKGAAAVLVSTSTAVPGGQTVARQRWTGVQQRFSGAAVASSANAEKVTELNGSGDAVETQRALPDLRGVLARFPRDTQATSYRRWDPETGRTGTAEFERRTRLEGKEVLVFRQNEPATSSIVRGTSTASETLLWVRPEVGAVVKTAVHVVVRSGPEDRTTLDARFIDDAASVSRASSQVDRAVRRHQIAGTLIPAVILFVGMMAALAAVLEGRTGRLDNRVRRRSLKGTQ